MNYYLYIWCDLESHKIFIGHGGSELDRIDQIKNGDTLVVLPEIKDMVELKNNIYIDSVTFSHTSKVLAFGSENNTIKLWHVREEDGSLIGH